MTFTISVLSFLLVFTTRTTINVNGWIPVSPHHALLLLKQTAVTTGTTTALRSSSLSTNNDLDTMTVPSPAIRNTRAHIFGSHPSESSVLLQTPTSRRESLIRLLSQSGALLTTLTVLTTSSTMNPTIAAAAAAAATSSSSSSSSIITPEEIKRIQIGYEQINYLLDHFEEETTVCRENGGECKRDANAIRKVLGLRSTTDPLFQIEKVFAKFKNLNLDDGDPDVDIEALYDAAEDWNSSISMSNSMAFISQFGEYNPGGGKDEVLKYLLESKKQVLFAKDALQTIMINLKIPLSST